MDTYTHRLRSLLGWLSLLSILIALIPQRSYAAPRQTTTLPIRPTLECVVEIETDRYIALFGYNNEATTPQTIPIGPDNYFHPTPQNRGQPTIFESGRQYGIFTVLFDGNPIVWKIGTRTVTASASSQRCSSQITNLLTSNLLRNGDIEQGTSFWTCLNRCTLQADSTTVYSGTKSLLITERTESWTGPNQIITGIIAKQQLYHTSARIRVQSGNGSARISLYIRTTDNQHHWQFSPTVPITTEWTLLQGLWYPDWQGDIAEARWYIEVAGANSYPNFFIDDATLQLAPEASGANLFKNPQFANGTDHWVCRYNVCTPSIVADGPRSAVLKTTDRQNTWAGPTQFLTSTLTLQQPYTSSAQIRLESGTTSTKVRMSVYLKDSTGREQYITVAETTGDDQWTTLQGAFLPVWQGTLEQAYWYLETPETTEHPNIYLDTPILKAVQLQEPTNQPPIVETRVIELLAGSTIELDLATTASDADGDILSFALMQGPNAGEASLAGSTLTYTSTTTTATTDTITYNVSDGQGGTAEGEILITVLDGGNNTPPQIQASANPISGTVPLTVTLNAQVSDADGDPLTTTWDLGDGSSATGETVTHVYTQTGVYTATATVSDGQATATDAIVIPVTDSSGNINNPPTAIDGTLITTINRTAQLDLALLTNDIDNDLLEYSITANPTYGTSLLNGSTLIYTPTTSYTGTDLLGYTVSDGQGGQATASITITINNINQAPTVHLRATPTRGQAPLTVALTAEAQDPEGSPLSFQWLLGDGTSITNTTQITHTYLTTGTWQPRVIVTDNQGAATVQAIPIYVLSTNPANQAPIAESTQVTITNQGAYNLELEFFVTDADGDELTYTLGNQPIQGNANIQATSLVYTPTATYTGVDSLTYLATDPYGATSEGTITFNITAIPPQNTIPTIALTANPLTGTAPLEVDFQATTSDADGDALTHIWDFGDGSTTTNQTNVTHTYTTPGHYGVLVSADDGRGGKVSVTTMITVSDASGNLAPQAKDSGGTWSIDNPTVTFDLSTLIDDPNNDILSIDLETQPEYGTAALVGSTLIYTATGLYTETSELTYRVTDSAGASDTGIIRTSRNSLLAEGNIVVGANAAAIGAPPNALTQPVTLNLVLTDTVPLSLPYTSMVVYGDLYALEVYTNTYIPSESSAFVVGLPVPTAIPTDSLVLASYLPNPTADLTGTWTFFPGAYDAVHGLYLGDIGALKDGTILTLVGRSDLARPTSVLHIHDDTDTQDRSGNRSQQRTTTQTQATTWNTNFVLMDDAPWRPNPGDLTQGIINNYITNIAIVLTWYQTHGFAEPTLMTHNGTYWTNPNLASTLLFPRPRSIQPNQEYKAFFILGEGDVFGMCDDELGSYYHNSAQLFLCFKPGQQNLTQTARRTIAHEVAHAVQFSKGYPSLRRSALQAESWRVDYLIEGTAEVLSAFWEGSTTLKRSPDFDPRQIGEPFLGPSDKTAYYATQDFWYHWARTFGSYDAGVGAIETLFATTSSAKVNGVNQVFQTLSSKNFSRLYWEWVRDHVYEDPSYLGPGLGPCTINTAVYNAPKAELLDPDSGNTISSIAYFIDPSQDASKTYEFFNTMSGLTANMVPILVLNASGNEATVRITVDKSSYGPVKVGLYDTNTCDAGEGTTLQKEYTIAAGGTADVYALIANTAMGESAESRDISITIEVLPIPVNDDYTQASNEIIVDAGGSVTIDSIFDNDLPNGFQDQFEIINHRLYDAVNIDIIDGGKQVVVYAPTGDEWERCDDDPIPFDAFGYQIGIIDGAQNTTKIAKVRLLIKPTPKTTECDAMIAVDDFETATPGATFTVLVKNNDFLGTHLPGNVGVLIMSGSGTPEPPPPALAQGITYRVPEVETCSPRMRQDTLTYRLIDTVTGDLSNIANVTIQYPEKLKADCQSQTEEQFQRRTNPQPSTANNEFGWVPWAVGGAVVVGTVACYLTVGCGVAYVATGLALVIGGATLAPRAMANTTGDPHVTTLDGAAFSSMHLGEFIYAQPTLTDTLELQVRQQRLPGFPDWASFNTAAAVKAGGHVFEVRLPQNSSNDFILKIDGEIADLAPGIYTYDDAIIRIDPGNALNVFVAEQGFENITGQDQLTLVRIGRSVDPNLASQANTPAIALDVSLQTPLTGNFQGMFGIPDGEYNNDLTLPSGAHALSVDDFVESWRVSEQDSLFTYVGSESYATINIPQTAIAPTASDLEADGYLQQARDLLDTSCGANVDEIEPIVIRRLALDLAAGRPASDLIASGVCQDESVAYPGNAEPPALMGLQFGGRLTLEGYPEVGIPGAKVSISSPTLGRVLCESGTFNQGRYQCSLTEYPISASEIVIRYRITGRGQTIQHETTIPTPQPGTVHVEQHDFAAQIDRVLYLTGQITDPAGAPLSNARLQLTGPSLYQTTASITGAYEVFMPIPNGMTLTTLNYEAADPQFRTYTKISRTLELTQTGIIPLVQDLQVENLPPPQVITGTLPVNLQRRLLVGGTISNTLFPNQPTPVGGATIQVSSPYLVDGGCQTTTAANGGYQCSAIITSTVATTFTVDVTVSGMGETQILQAIVGVDEIPVEGTTLVKIVDGQVTPTMLYLTGTVRGDDQPLIGATVRVQSPTGAAAQSTSSLTGRYSLYLPIPNTDVQSGTVGLSYAVSYASLTGSTSMTKVATATNVVTGTINPHMEDINFTARTVAFTGRVRNELLPGVVVPGAQMTISSPTYGTICTTYTDSGGWYSCDLSITNTTPFSVSYSIDKRGSFTSSAFNVDPTGLPVTGRLPFSESFEVAPTTLKLTGTIADKDGTTRQGVRFSAYGVGGAQALAQTFDDGTYQTYAMLDNGIVSGTLHVRASYTASFEQLEVAGDIPINATAYALNDIPINLTFTEAFLDPALATRLRFYGRVGNQTEPLADMSGIKVSVKAAPFGDLCIATTGGNGNYSCSVTVPNHDPLNIQYELIGYGAPFTHTFDPVPGLAFENDILKDLLFAPASVLLQGTVVDLANQPVGLHPVQFSGAVQGSTNTNEQGQYELFRPIPLASLTGIITTSVSSGSNFRSVGQTYTSTVGQLTTLPTLQLQLPQPVIDTTPISLSGILAAGETQTQTLTISNTGSVDLVVTPYAASGAGVWIEVSATPLTIAPNTSAQLVVTLDAGQLVSGTYEGDLILSSNDPVQPSLAVPVTLQVSGTPSLRVSPIKLAYGTIYVGYPETQTLILQNVGTAPLTITSITSSDPFFMVNPVSGTIAPNDQLNVTVVASPTLVRATDASITIESSAGFAVVPIKSTISEPTGAREVMFTGLLSNTLVPTYTVPAGYRSHTVNISAVGQGALCSTYVSYTPDYTCTATVDLSEPLTVLYTVSGEWGTTTITKTDVITSLPPFGTSTTVTQNLGINPTTLLFTGQVLDNQGQPLSNTLVRVTSNELTSITAAPQASTDADGYYRFYALLDAGVSNPQFSYEVTFNGQTLQRSFFVPVTPRMFNSVERDFSLNRVRFVGSIINSLAPPTSVVHQVHVELPSGESLCSDTYVVIDYSCEADLATGSNTEVVYTLSGDWGTTSYTTTVSGLPNTGTTVPFTSNLTYTPTVLLLTGTVDNGTGPVSGASVSAYSQDFASFDPAITDATGVYSLYVVLKSNALSGTFDLIATSNGASASANDTPFMAQSNQLTSIDTDLTFSSRRYLFQGTVRNGFVPEMPIVSSYLTIQTPAGTACSVYTHWSQGTYQCAYDTFDGTAFPVTYTLSGDWGTAQFTRTLNTIAAPGAQLPVVEPLTPTMTTVRIHGQLQNMDTTPTNNRWISSGSPVVSASSPSALRSAYTSASGGYTHTVILKANVLSGTLELNGSIKEGSFQDTVPFSATVDQLTDIPYDIAYTGLVLTGTVQTGTGEALPNTYVYINGADLTSSYSTYADGNGAYTVYLPIKPGVSTGTLEVQLIYNSTILEYTLPFTVTQDQVNVQNQNLIFDAFELILRGDVINEHIPPTFSPRTLRGPIEMVISAEGYGELCTDSIYNTYYCNVDLAANISLPITYTLIGPWDTIQATTVVTPQASSSSFTIDRDFTARPTTLHITGNVEFGDGTTPSGGYLYIDGDAMLDENQYVPLDANGNYEAYLALDKDVTAGTLQYTVYAGNISQVYPVTFTATAGELSDLNQDFVFNQREVYFSGSIRNAFASTTTVPATSVQVLGPEGEICRYTSNGNSNYSCRGYVTSTQAFNVQYVVQGAWGSTTVAGQVNAGALGSYQSYSVNLLVEPTTILLSGQTKLPAGTPVQGYVQVQSSSLLQDLYQTADTSGNYALVAMVKSGVTSVPLTYTVTYNNVSRIHQVNVPVTSGASQPYVFNLETGLRQVHFSGQIVNSGTGQPLSSTRVDVRTDTGELICSWDYSYGYTSYSCTGAIATTAAQNVVYTISGPWGTSQTTGTVPAGTTYINYTNPLAASPTMLQLTGIVQTANNLPRVGLYVNASNIGGGVLQQLPVASTATGAYTTNLVLSNTLTSGTLVVTLSTNPIMTDTINWTATPNTVNPINYNWSIAQRTVSIYGPIYHELDSSVYVSADLVEIRTQSNELLCSDPTPGTNFSCVATLNTPTTVEAVAVVSGGWGSVTQNVTLSAGALGSSSSAYAPVAVNPTMLVLNGQMLDDRGAPVSNATVSIHSPAFAALVPVQGSTYSNGWYTVTAALAQGQTSGSLAYTVTLNNRSVNLVEPFTVGPNAFTPVRKDGSLTARPIAFYGYLSHEQFPNLSLESEGIQIQTLAGDPLCSQDLNGGSYYYCELSLPSSDAISVTAVVTGAWGSQSFTLGIPGDTSSDTSTYQIQQDLILSPPTLLLTGKLFKDDAAISGSVEAGLEAVAASYSPSTYTDSSGAYTLPLILKQSSTTQTLVLTSQSYLNGYYIDQVKQIQLDPTSNGVTPLTQDWDFGGRVVYFNGYVYHALDNDQPLDWTTLTIEATGQDFVCRIEHTTNTSGYNCPMMLHTSAAVPVVYTLSGDWGTKIINGEISAGTTNLNLRRDLFASPTAVKIMGTVRSNTNAPIYNAKVEIVTGDLSVPATYTPTVWTNNQGVFEAFLLIDAGVTSTNVTYRIMIGSQAPIERQAVWTLQPQGVLTQTPTLTLD